MVNKTFKGVSNNTELRFIKSLLFMDLALRLNESDFRSDELSP